MKKILVKRISLLLAVAVTALTLTACGSKRHALPDVLYENTVASSAPVATAVPTVAPTAVPTPVPTVAPIPVPTVVPTPVPTVAPTLVPTAAPTVSTYLRLTKSPTGEVVDEGGTAYFVARADNYTGITWYVANSNNSIIYHDNMASQMFSGLQISGVGTEMLCLSGIPYEMSGWKVYASFSGLGGPVQTDAAYITVNKVFIRTNESSNTEVQTIDLIGPWHLDQEKTDISAIEADMNTFPGYAEWGASMEIRSNGQMSWYIGAVGGSGTYIIEDGVLHAKLTDSMEQKELTMDFQTVGKDAIKMTYANTEIIWAYGDQEDMEKHPGPDVAELVNLRGDKTTVYKLADGTYMDRVTMRFNYDGIDTWFDEDGVEWNEDVK